MGKFIDWLISLFKSAPKVEAPKNVDAPKVDAGNQVATLVTCPSNPGEYIVKFEAAKVNDRNLAEIKARAALLLKYKDSHYQPIADKLNCAWWIPAVIHNQEMGSDVGTFKACLHNGERIIGTGRKTTLVPKGHGPFATFEEAAIDALSSEGFSGKKNLGEILGKLEGYNGIGYRKHGVASPYLWAMTNQYTKGHYVADGVWDANAVSQNYGIVAILKCLEENDQWKLS